MPTWWHADKSPRCHDTGWVHTVDERNWDCVGMMKLNCDNPIKVHVDTLAAQEDGRQQFGANPDLVNGSLPSLLCRFIICSGMFFSH